LVPDKNHSKGRAKTMSKFNLKDRMKIIGNSDVRTVQEIREMPGETLYCVQLGSNFVTRVWAKESDLERAD